MLRSFSNTVRKFNVHLNPFLGTRHETPNLLVAGNVYQRQYSDKVGAFGTLNPLVVANDGRKSYSVDLPKPTNITKPSTALSENSKNDADDEIIKQFKSAENDRDLFEMIPIDGFLSDETLLHAFGTLFFLKKTKNTLLSSNDLMKHPKFKLLCKRAEIAAQNLNDTNVLEIVKILSFLGVPTDADVFLSLLDVLRLRANELSLDNISFLSFLLTKQKPTPLIKSLQSVLPQKFETRLNDMDRNDFPKLLGHLNYVSTHAKNMSPKTIENIVTAVMAQRSKITVQNAISIIWNLSTFDIHKFDYTELLNCCIDILCDSIGEVKSVSLLRLLTRMVSCVVDGTDAFYSEKFLNRFVEKIIKEKIQLLDTLTMANDLRQLNFASDAMLNYVSERATEEVDILFQASYFQVYALISFFADANFIPPNWSNVILPAILKNEIFLQVNRRDRPWLKFFEALCSLNYTDLKYIGTIFQKGYLNDYFEEHTDKSDYINLLNLHQIVACRRINSFDSGDCQDHLAVAFDFQTDSIEEIISGCYLPEVLDKGYILQEVVTVYGHTIPYIVIQKIATGELVNTTKFEDANSTGFIPLDNIMCGDDERIVAILYWPARCYARNAPRLKGAYANVEKQIENIGLDFVSISEMQWKNLREDEQNPFLISRINSKFHFNE